MVVYGIGLPEKAEVIKLRYSYLEIAKNLHGNLLSHVMKIAMLNVVEKIRYLVANVNASVTDNKRVTIICICGRAI